MYAIIIIIGFSIVFTLIMTSFINKVQKKNTLEQANDILNLLKIDNNDVDVFYSPGNKAVWNCYINNTDLRFEYFSNKKLYHDSFVIKIPYMTKRIFFLKNINVSPFDKNAFLQSNEICLNYIKDIKLINELTYLLDDNRFIMLTTKMDAFSTKFVTVPKYDENNKIINYENKSKTDALAIHLARPNLQANRNKENDFDYDFLMSMISLLNRVKLEIE